MNWSEHITDKNKTFEKEFQYNLDLSIASIWTWLYDLKKLCLANCPGYKL